MGNEVELTKYLSELAGRIWVPRAIADALAVPWVPLLLLGVLGAVLFGRAFWTLYRSTAIPVVRVFILMGYLLVALLLLDITAAISIVVLVGGLVLFAGVSVEPGGDIPVDADRDGQAGTI